MSGQGAIVTLVLGERFQNLWQTYCEWNWRQYAEKHNLDLIVLTEPLDRSDRAQSRSPSWQKCLILSQEFSQNYSQIIWLDADIVINTRKAPSILAEVPADKIGGVASGAYIHPDLRMVLLERLRGEECEYGNADNLWKADQQRFYQSFGFDFAGDILQAGVLVFNPIEHRELLENVYYSEYPETRSYEQIPLSYEVMRRELFAPINSRFNTVFYEKMVVHYPYLLDKELDGYDILAAYAVVTELENAFFLHFAYDSVFMEYLLFGQLSS
jgi:lipopolysaccharide biosynthesis glycosyltransferase